MPATAWACAIASPNPTVRRPTAKPNALSVLPCANGLTASSIIIQIREPPCSIAGRTTTTGIDRIRVSAVCRLLLDFRGMGITCCKFTPRDVAELSAAIHANGASGGVVVLDTLNRAVPGAEENDSKDMGAIIAAAKTLQRGVGGWVILVHHTGRTPKGCVATQFAGGLGRRDRSVSQRRAP